MPAQSQTITSYSLKEAAERVGVSRITLWRDIRDGKLVVQKTGTRVFIFADDLLDYVLRSRGGKGIPTP